MNNKNTNTEHLAKLLASFGDRYVDSNGILKKGNLVHDVRNDDPALFKALVHDPLVMHGYAKAVDGIQVFDKDKFITTVSDDKLWHHNYTEFRNHIGLTVSNKYINDSSDVVLDFPHKDCVLQGGMTKEENDTDIHENFYNDTISRLQVTDMFAPKILCHAKRYDKDHTTDVPTDSFDPKHDSLMIKANNLIALHSLLPVYRGKVKLIYIDPPYNTGSDSFKYNDDFNHSTWLVFMKNRLDIAKELLSDDGFIVVQTDDSEQAYLKVLMDEVFGRDKYLNTVTVKTKASSGVSGGGEDKRLKKNIEFLTIYANHSAQIKTPVKSELLSRYILSRKLEGKSFAYKSVMTKPGKMIPIGSTKDGRGKPISLYKVAGYKIDSVKNLSRKLQISEEDVYNKYLNQIFTTENAQTSIRTRVKEAVGPNNDDYVIARYKPVSGRHKGQITDVGFIGRTKRLVSFISATAYEKHHKAYKDVKMGTLWNDLSWSSIKKEGDVAFPNGEKPEALIKRIISMTTRKGDIVLDFFAGSATTQSVAMKMHRRFIGIEQMDYFDTISVPRLQNVIKGDQSGISKDVDWKGGGSFVKATFLNHNQAYINAIQDADSFQSLDKVCAEISTDADIRLDVDFQKLVDDLHKLSLSEAKRSLLDSLDKNQLYYNEADIDDANVRHLPGLSDTDYQFNQSFYRKDNE